MLLLGSNHFLIIYFHVLIFDLVAAVITAWVANNLANKSSSSGSLAIVLFLSFSRGSELFPILHHHKHVLFLVISLLLPLY